VTDLLRYDKMVEGALRGVVRAVLARTTKEGLLGAHHFYITFRTAAPGVAMPDYLKTQYPAEMTVVLEHQFWDLEVGEKSFAVTLSFKSRNERLTIPFAAITGFTDPSVKFGLQFQPEAEPAAAEPKPAKSESRGKAETRDKPAAASKAGEVVALDKFRKK